MRHFEKVLAAVLFCSLFCFHSLTFASDVPKDTKSSWGPERMVTNPTFESDTDNGDGTWTFIQRIDGASTPPHYYGPFYTPDSYCDDWAGFDYYSWFDQDYGWQHNFPHWNDPTLILRSATLTIVAWDVDSEVEWGLEGEYDAVRADGILMDPGYLQGQNNQWSTTVFDVPASSLTDDGLMDISLDIDIRHTECWWATTLDYTQLTVVYSIGGQVPNHGPYPPQVVTSPGLPNCPLDSDNLVVTVTGPVPADPDGDAVTYRYRWFVNVGTGAFVDDEFAGRGDHTGNTVPAADTQNGDIWRVQVTPVDSKGAIGNYSTATFNQVGGPTQVVPMTWGKLKASFK